MYVYLLARPPGREGGREGGKRGGETEYTISCIIHPQINDINPIRFLLIAIPTDTDSIMRLKYRRKDIPRPHSVC